MNHSEAEHQYAKKIAIETAKLFELYASDIDLIVLELEARGYSNLAARKWTVLVQSGFAWALLKKMGVHNFSSTFILHAKSGEYRIPIDSQVIFLGALDVATDIIQNGYNQDFSKRAFSAVIQNSPEINAAAQLLDGGEDIGAATLTTTLMGFTANDFGLSPKTASSKRSEVWSLSNYLKASPIGWPEFYRRLEAIEKLQLIGALEAIPILEHVAQTDTQEFDAWGLGSGVSLADFANTAIAEIKIKNGFTGAF